MQEIDTKIIVPFKDKDIEFLTRSESGYDVTVTDKIVIREIYFENVYRVSEADLDDTGIVVDIGGNIGAFSLFAWALGAKKVIAFEPDTQNLNLLNLNIANNHADNIFIQPVGIYSSEGVQTLLNGQGASYIVGNKTPTPKAQRIIDAGDTPKETIHTITLQQALEANDITDVDVLKIDCEGSEYAIINSTPSDILNRFRYITVEFHITKATTFGKTIALLTKTHKVETLGSYERGGQLYCKRY